jgi:hypothetical protein
MFIIKFVCLSIKKGIELNTIPNVFFSTIDYCILYAFTWTDLFFPCSVWVARKPPGFAFIDFDDRRDAQDAIRDLDGT